MKNVVIRSKAERHQRGFLVIPPATIEVDGVVQERVISCAVEFQRGDVPVVTLKFIPEELLVDIDVPEVETS